MGNYKSNILGFMKQELCGLKKHETRHSMQFINESS